VVRDRNTGAPLSDVYGNDERIQPRTGNPESYDDTCNMDAAQEFARRTRSRFSAIGQGSSLILASARAANGENRCRDYGKDQRDGCDDRELREKIRRSEIAGSSDSGTTNWRTVEEVSSSAWEASLEADSEVARGTLKLVSSQSGTVRKITVVSEQAPKERKSGYDTDFSALENPRLFEYCEGHLMIASASSVLIQFCFLSELRGFSLRTSRFKAFVCQTRTP
jgi:hypothetical protein